MSTSPSSQSPITPATKGGKGLVNRAEVEATLRLAGEVIAIGPINTEATARLYRIALSKYQRDTKKIPPTKPLEIEKTFKALRLPC